MKKINTDDAICYFLFNIDLNQFVLTVFRLYRFPKALDLGEISMIYYFYLEKRK